jgi:RNA polymerase sigma factor (sigma-70 family)
MRPLNPLVDDDRGDLDDQGFVTRAQAGDRDALETLVRRHQPWIYNLALRMLAHPADAQDAMQEILIKALTHLASFEGRSRFRTWLYRIAVHHVLNMKRGRAERTLNFGDYGRALDGTPDLELPDPATVPADLRLLVDEARLGCTSAMLLCLDRDQRMVYVLGEIFGVTDAVGAELLETSRENFRQRLARARRDLHTFMNDKCGLVNQANPCRCARKTQAFIRCGHVDPENLLFARERVQQIRDVAPRKADALTALDAQCAEIFRQHPFAEPEDLVPKLRQLIDSPEFRRATDLP